MHNILAIFGFVVSVILVLSILTLAVGLVWIFFPPKDKQYMGSVYIYRYITPLGGRDRGLNILCLGFIGLVLGISLDRVHTRLAGKSGHRT